MAIASLVEKPGFAGSWGTSRLLENWDKWNAEHKYGGSTATTQEKTHKGANSLSKKAHAASLVAEKVSTDSLEHKNTSQHHADVDYAVKQSSRAVDYGRQKQNASSRKHHEDASREHSMIAKKQGEMGYKEVASAHQKAAEAHNEAAKYRNEMANQ